MSGRPRAEVQNPQLADDIITLLNEDLPVREIARRVGVNRNTVRNVVNRYVFRSEQRPEVAIVAPSGPYVRCPTCGGKVQMPCVACGALK